MILSEKTISVLSNFSTINQSILVKPGTKLRTMSVSEAVVAQADVEDEFPREFGIHDLSQFLALLSLSKENEIEFQEKYLLIKQGSSSIKFYYCDPILIKKMPAGNLKFPEPYIEFNLPWAALSNTTKAMQILKFNELSFSGDGETLRVCAVNSKSVDQNSYLTDLGDTKKVFNCVIEFEKLKLLPSDYFVRVTDKGMIHLKSDVVEYWIAININKSTFE